MAAEPSVTAVVDAARRMPRATPGAGGASSVYTYALVAGDVWALDKALTEYDAMSAAPPAPPDAVELACAIAFKPGAGLSHSQQTWLRTEIAAALTSHAARQVAEAVAALSKVHRLLTYPSDAKARSFPPLLETPQDQQARFDYQDKVIDEAIEVLAAATAGKMDHVAEAVAAERERCAKIVHLRYAIGATRADLVAAIRAGDKGGAG